MRPTPGSVAATAASAVGASRPIDVVCMGRAAVDLYGEQVGGRLEDMRSFAKYLGGSPANTAVGVARLGLKPAMLTRVGDEHHGRFVRERLAAEGVDVRHVTTDPKRLTALVFLGIRDRENFPLVFYRDQCADMGLVPADIDPVLIASAQALLLSGTHLSQPGPLQACRAAVALARAAGTRIVLDIDYRPVLWGLTAPGLGEQRYVASAAVSAQLQTIVGDCDLIVGTEEEIRIAGGSGDTLAALRRLRELTTATLVCKRGPIGCVVFDGAIPDDLDHGLAGPGFPVEVFNVLGAGDAFMAGFLRGWLRHEPLARCAAFANACGALVVSRHGCAPAMPSWVELQQFLAHGSSQHALRMDVGLEHLHRTTTRLVHWPALAVLAFDHRSQFVELAGEAGLRDSAAAERIGRFKRLLVEGARAGAATWAATATAGRTAIGTAGPTTIGTKARTAATASGPAAADQAAVRPPAFGILLDDRYGEDVLPLLTGSGWWIGRPVEVPGSRPLAFEVADLALAMRAWPTEHVAKCLLIHHPDDPAALRALQMERLCALQRACLGTDRELLVEVIPPREAASDADTLARALTQIYEAGVRPDWWKLPPPESDTAWLQIAACIAHHDPQCRGVLLLGLEASEADLAQSFAAAAPHAVCKGFAVGRSIFAEPAAAWFAGRIDDAAVIAAVADRYARLITLWQRARSPQLLENAA
ncbi:MAG: 5-dehydro-2-deoxygluconokinase [Pseudomonadota bacterium]|nr:5-dehydro-2-deoxygluconokinase [Pseudomonadota bacterium]